MQLIEDNIFTILQNICDIIILDNIWNIYILLWLPIKANCLLDFI